MIDQMPLLEPQQRRPRPSSFLARCGRAWDDFFFSPRDPTALGMMRICCGLIVVYTLIAYTVDLENFFGKDAWYDLATRNETRETERINPLPWGWFAPQSPNLPQEIVSEPRLLDDLVSLLDKGRDTSSHIAAFEKKYPQMAGKTRAFLAENRQELEKVKASPKGTTEWSIWFHVTDPTAMWIVHHFFIVAAVLFSLGFCTRITAALTWFAMLSYINRSTTTVFGVDTMASITLLYLMIGPSGAALSVDRLIWRWWVSYRSLRQLSRSQERAGTPGENTQRAAPLAVTPSVGANVAIRLLQIHLCIIYLAAGLAKLQGNFWWEGSAVWGTIANFEFAPMQMEWYMAFLRFLAKNRFFWELFMTTASVFTLVYEISFSFLIWHRRTRWVILSMAVALHGGIGLFMGLKTFSMIMLAMCLAFVAPETIHRLLRALARAPGGMKLMFTGATGSLRAASVVHAFDIWSQVELVQSPRPGASPQDGAGPTELVTPSGETLKGRALRWRLFVSLGIFRVFAPWCWPRAVFGRSVSPAAPASGSPKTPGSRKSRSEGRNPTHIQKMK